MADNKSDQSDVIAQNAKLTTDLAAASGSVTKLTADLATANGSVTKLTADLATANASIATKDSEIAALKVERDNAKAEAAKVTSEAKTVADAVAATVVKLGITPGAKTEEKKDGKKLTATEQILAAKGVKSLAELEAKRPVTV